MSLTYEELHTFVPMMAELETENPMISLWRNAGGRSPQPSLRRLREIAWLGRDAVLRNRPLQRPERGQVVILSYSATPSTLGTLLPVMAELHRQGRPAFFISSHKTAHVLERNLHKGHADLQHILATAPTWERLKLRSRARAMAERIRNILTDGLDGCSEIWLEMGLAAQFAARQWIAGAGAMIADSDVEPIRKGFFLGAMQTGVPSFILQHGMLDLFNFPMHADQFLAWGEYFRKQALQLGALSERVVAVGSPRWDPLATERNNPRDPRIRAALGGKAGGPLVVLMSQGHGAATQPGYFDALFEGLTRLLTAGIDVAIKLHPAEAGLDAYRGRVPGHLLERVRVVPPEIGLNQALLHADVAYTAFSAASIDAMLLGVPVLFGRADSGVQLCDCPDFGGGVWVSPDDIVERCHELAGDGAERRAVIERQETFLDYALANRGKAAEKAVQRILSAARN